jgi:DNA recombination protein RmuC
MASSSFPALILGLLLGALVAWLLLRPRQAVLVALLDAERRTGAQRHRDQESAEAQLRDAFASVSHQALETNNRAFLDLAQSRLGETEQRALAEFTARHAAVDALIAPMQERMDALLRAVGALDLSRAESAAAIGQQMTAVAEGQLRLKRETEQLVQALRAPQVRGRWGEMQLRRVVEMAGMIPHCDFAEQTTVQGDDGRLRPDLVVRLPGDKVIVVDSKTPLDAYLAALEATDDGQRDAHLDRHARQVKTHISALARKDYADQFAAAPDFVVLFVPGETFLSEACRRDPDLLDFAINQRVIPASPTTLITLLKAVSYGWQQQRVAESAEQLRDLGIELHDRVRKVAEHFAGVGKGLSQAVRAYNDAVGSLEGRVLPTARRFRELGAGGKSEIEPLIPVTEATRALRSDSGD